MKKIILKINKLLATKIPNNFFYKWIYFLKFKFYLYKLKRQHKKLISNNNKWANHKVRIKIWLNLLSIYLKEKNIILST